MRQRVPGRAPTANRMMAPPLDAAFAKLAK